LLHRWTGVQLPASKSSNGVDSVVLEKVNRALDILGLSPNRHYSAYELHQAHDRQTRGVAPNKRKSFTVPLQYLLSHEGKEVLITLKELLPQGGHPNGLRARSHSLLEAA